MLVGRKNELEQLNTAYYSGKFEFAVVYGRRHIGKTFLVSDFLKNKQALYFSAREVNDKCNLDAFSDMINNYTGTNIRFARWEEAFAYIGSVIGEDRLVLVLDNFTDACIAGKEFCVALQKSIDRYFRNRNLFLIICGNHTSALEREVFASKSPLHNHVTLKLHLDCLTYQEACSFFTGFSDEDKIRLYSCVGGTPLYLKQINNQESFEDNIIRLFFSPDGYIYNDIFMLLRRELIGPVVYNSILRSVAYGKTRLREIVDEIGEENAKTSKYCKVLLAMDILDRSVPYGSDSETSRKNSYYFKDNAHLFWYRFVFNNELIISTEQGAEFAKRYVFGKTMDEFIANQTFGRVCMQYFNQRALNGRLSFAPEFIGRTSERSDADIIVSNENGTNSVIIECRWAGPAVEASDINAFAANSDKYAEESQKSYSIISANGFKTDAIRIANARKDIELLGLNDLEAEK